ncbi:MAG: RluA family pseudouridine synthase [Acutalibacteraceae bacterium]
MSDIRESIVSLQFDNIRIDKYLSLIYQDFTRSYFSNLLENSNVLVNGFAVAKNYKVKTGDRIVFQIPEPISYDVKAENIPLDIIYEDDDLLVVNKEKGMVVHPAPGNYTGTLVNALMYHCKDNLSGINGVLRPGILHRIDKNTSGLLIVAKNDLSHNFLAEQIKEHSFTREYEAVVYGGFKKDWGTVDAPIGRNPADRKKMCVTEKNSKNAVTHYSIIQKYNGFSHIKCSLETGRTHQIRVHMAYIGHPVAGDDVYGPKKVIKELHGQCLHAKKIGFIHPTTRQYIEFDSFLPPYFMNFISVISK